MPSARRRRLTILQQLLASALLLLMALANPTRAHIGGKVYPIYELTDGDLAQINLLDGSVEEWERSLPAPTIVSAELYCDPTVGDGAQYDPADLDTRTWLAWNGSTGRVYLAMERIDNAYVNAYAGGDVYQIWKEDSLEFMVDGDHSGGDYTGSADPAWTADEQKLNYDRTAQMYYAIATAPDRHTIGYMGFGGGWVDWPPYTDGGGGHRGGSPDTSVTEFYVTPFDDLRWDDPQQSVSSRLYAGKTIGWSLSVPDWDVAGTCRGYQTLAPSTASWRYASKFVDGRLLPAEPTAIPSTTWARIKASFR